MFKVSSESLKEVKRLLKDEFKRGLESEREDVNVKMFVTHIHKMPEGTEEGEFLVVDLGVYHLRVLHIGTFTFNSSNSILVSSVNFGGVQILRTGDLFNFHKCTRLPYLLDQTLLLISMPNFVQHHSDVAFIDIRRCQRGNP